MHRSWEWSGWRVRAYFITAATKEVPGMRVTRLLWEIWTLAM
jgi:hypothetical protein